MQRVGADGSGAGDFDHMLLEHQQGGGQAQGYQHYGDTQALGAEGFRVQHAVDTLDADQNRTDADEQRLPQACEGLGLTVAVAVIVIRRAQGIVHGQQVEQRGGAVQQRIGQPRQQAHRAAHPPGNRLGQRQDESNDQCGATGQAH